MAVSCVRVFHRRFNSPFPNEKEQTQGAHGPIEDGEYEAKVSEAEG